MKAKERREALKKELLHHTKPISATALAKQFNVSRQVIVGDIALLRAAQEPIIATARGYIYKQDTNTSYVIACMHNENETKQELETIVDLGGTIENVIVAHPVYGELCGQLHVSSRYEVNEFIERCHHTHAKNLSSVSDGMHFHTITCKDTEQFDRIRNALREKGFLYEKE